MVSLVTYESATMQVIGHVWTKVKAHRVLLVDLLQLLTNIFRSALTV